MAKPSDEDELRQQLLNKEVISGQLKFIITEYFKSFDAYEHLNSKDQSLVKLLPYKVSRDIREHIRTNHSLVDWDQLHVVIKESIASSISLPTSFTEFGLSIFHILDDEIFVKLKSYLDGNRTESKEDNCNDTHLNNTTETPKSNPENGQEYVSALEFWDQESFDSESYDSDVSPLSSFDHSLPSDPVSPISCSSSSIPGDKICNAKSSTQNDTITIPGIFKSTKSKTVLEVEPDDDDKGRDEDTQNSDAQDDDVVESNGTGDDGTNHLDTEDEPTTAPAEQNPSDNAISAQNDMEVQNCEAPEVNNSIAPSCSTNGLCDPSQLNNLNPIDSNDVGFEEIEDHFQEEETSNSPTESASTSNKKETTNKKESGRLSLLDAFINSIDNSVRECDKVSKRKSTIDDAPNGEGTSRKSTTRKTSTQSTQNMEYNDEDDDDSDLDAYQVDNNNDSSNDDENQRRLSSARKKKKKKKNQINSSSDTDTPPTRANADNSTDEEDRIGIKPRSKKFKRRRVVVSSTPSESSGSDFEAKVKEFPNTDSDDEEMPIKSRKKIRKIKDDSKLQKNTIEAERSEKEKRKRLEDKEKAVQECLQDVPAVQELVLDINKETKEVLVKVDAVFCQLLKKHQLDGIKFLYNSTIEGIDRLKEGDPGSGCILAHSMGLGKTFQIVTFIFTIFLHEELRRHLKRFLILVPKNVIDNWVNEFQLWRDECNVDQNFKIYNLGEDNITLKTRMAYCSEWHQEGGVLVVTTTIYKNMITAKLPKVKKSKAAETREQIKKYLLNPGPDVLVFDEGHMMKNTTSKIHEAITGINTLRRIILTGTPLQNNLMEYYVMVNFIKPNLLGDTKEFANRFVNPITNGQQIDSTEADVKLMKKRVHVLHGLLKDCVHRCDYNVLVPYLPKKHEYVLAIKLQDVQAKLYRAYLQKCVDNSSLNTRLFGDYSKLSYVWNHPHLLKLGDNRNSQDEDDSSSTSTDSLKDFVVADDESEGSEDSNIEIIDDLPGDGIPNVAVPPAPASEPAPVSPAEWFEEHLPKDSRQLELSSKFMLLFKIIEKCETVGEKLLVFSQSVKTLKLVKYFLEKKDWIMNRDFFFIYGSTSCTDRSHQIKCINDPENLRARLMLLSTKACGLGINLTGANRCIIFDASWNPSNDLQAIYRIFRYGQTKNVFIYRFTAFGSMESKIYHRQIVKQSLSHRVVDEQQIQRHYRSSDLNELYELKMPSEEREVLNVPDDKLLADLILENEDNLIVSYHEHDSLLENKPEEGLSEEERKQAWNEYERVRQGETISTGTNLSALQTQEFLQQIQNDLRFNALNSLAAGSSNNMMLPSTSQSTAYGRYYRHQPVSNVIMQSTQARNYNLSISSDQNLATVRLNLSRHRINLDKLLAFKSVTFASRYERIRADLASKGWGARYWRISFKNFIDAYEKCFSLTQRELSSAGLKGHPIWTQLTHSIFNLRNIAFQFQQKCAQEDAEAIPHTSSNEVITLSD